VFEHLKRDPDDFVGGLHRVASRERLIHLFAFQSHLWNRTLSDWLAHHAQDSFALRNVEGKLVMPRGRIPLPEAWGGVLSLPGPRLDGVTDPELRSLFEAVLARHGLSPEQLDVQGVPGFQLAAEPRDAVVIPRELRMRPAKVDPLYPGRHMVELSFDLPRGAYATLVVQRLVGPRPSYGSHDAPWSTKGEAEFRHRRSGTDAGGEGPRRYGPRRGPQGGAARPRGRRSRGGPRGS
jgi:tRNA pseudouridine13 synthase